MPAHRRQTMEHTAAARACPHTQSTFYGMKMKFSHSLAYSTTPTQERNESQLMHVTSIATASVTRKKDEIENKIKFPFHKNYIRAYLSAALLAFISRRLTNVPSTKSHKYTRYAARRNTHRLSRENTLKTGPRRGRLGMKAQYANENRFLSLIFNYN